MSGGLLRKLRLLAPLVLTSYCGVVDGELRFSRALGSHMVLQQAPARANIWGYGAPSGAEVAVTLLATDHGVEHFVGTTTAIAGADGSFSVLLPPQSPGPRGSPTAHTIRATVTGDTSAAEMVQMVDVLFGEVWICGGSVSPMLVALVAADCTRNPLHFRRPCAVAVRL
eukprot:COSAG02_NODE_269_length_26468_cov_4.489021_3_plen_169_part_00